MYVIPIISIFFLVVLDQITKYIAVQLLEPINSITVIDGVLNFTFVKNTGAAFGIMEGNRIFLILTTIIIVILIIIYYINLPQDKPQKVLKIALVLIVSGALGNFIDRLINGYVVDFIHVVLFNFPVFNFADIMVVVGAGLFIFHIFFLDEEEEGE